MFCGNCGKKLEDDWTICPYCNTEIERESISGINESVYSADNRNYQNVPNIKKFSFAAYLLLSIITLGIYSIVVLYRFTKTVNILCEGDERESPNYIVVYLLNVVTIGIYSLVWMYKQAQRLNNIAPKYNAELSLNPISILLWNTFGSIIAIGPFIALYSMFKNVNLLVDNYNANNVNANFVFEPNTKTKQTKLVVIILCYYLFWVVFTFFMVCIATIMLRFDNTSGIDYSSLPKTESAITDTNSNDDKKDAPDNAAENEPEVETSSPEKYYEHTIKFLLDHPGMTGNGKVKVYGTFTSKNTIYIGSGDDMLEVIYDHSAYDEAGNEVGTVSTGDMGYVVGTYIAEFNTYIQADRIVLTDNIPADFMPEVETNQEIITTPEEEPNNQDDTFIGVEGSYLDFTYGSAYSSEINVYISDITENTLWFKIYNGDNLIFKHHMAEITGPSTAVYNGQEYTLNFIWSRDAELSITGFQEVENMTFINNGYLHTS